MGRKGYRNFEILIFLHQDTFFPLIPSGEASAHKFFVARIIKLIYFINSLCNVFNLNQFLDKAIKFHAM